MTGRRHALVTGGAGFIGSHLSDRLLNDGWDVTILDDLSRGLRDNVPSGARLVEADVTDSDAVRRAFGRPVDVVLHVAGQASTVRSFADPRRDIDVNLMGTVNIALAAAEHEVARVLFASSMTVYGRPERLPVSDRELTRPLSYYGVSKLAAERFLMATAARTDLPRSMHVTAFRMFNVYGPRQRLDDPYQGVLGLFLGQALSGAETIIHGTGEQTRDFVYIDDVVDLWARSIDDARAHEQTVNVGIGHGVSVNRLVDEVLAAVGTDRERHETRYEPRRQGDQDNMVAEIGVARSLGWEPRTDLSAGLRATLAWARDAEPTRQ